MKINLDNCSRVVVKAVACASCVRNGSSIARYMAIAPAFEQDVKHPWMLSILGCSVPF